MTVSNHHPLANPFNTRAFGNYNVDRQMQSGSYIKGLNSNNLQVPIAKPLSQEDLIERNNSLQVPHQNQIPMGQENNMVYLEPERFYQNGDTVIDLKTKQIVQQDKNDKGCWGSSKMKVKKYDDPNEWRNEEIYNLNSNNPSQQLSKSDIEYEKYCKQKETEMKNNMSDEQKELLNNLDEIFGKSKFEIDSLS